MADPTELQPQGKQVSGKLELYHYSKTEAVKDQTFKTSNFTELYYPFVVFFETLYITNEKRIGKRSSDREI